MAASNALTYVSLTAAMMAVAAAMHGSAAGAGACLALAALADTFDGRYARLFTRDAQTEAIGGHLDSLSDAVAFGAVPVVAMSVLLPAVGGVTSAIWWVAAVVYVACTLTRLAIYNVRARGGGSEVFIGIPAPGAALIWSTAFLTPLDVRVAIPVALATGAAMIAPLRIGRPHGPALLAFALWPVCLVIAHSLRA